jgi:hypothetical protein
MPGSFTTVEVADPHLITQLIWQSLPLGARSLADEQALDSSEYAPLDHRRFRIEPETYRMVWSTARIGGLRASHVTQSRATQLTVRSSAAEVPHIYISVFERGAARVILPGSDEPVLGNAAKGVIVPSGPGTKGAATDDTVQQLLRLPITLLSDRLKALLDGQRVDAVAFQPGFDQTRGAGATLRRMLDFLSPSCSIPTRCCGTRSRSAASRTTWRSACCSACLTATARPCRGRRQLPRRATCAGPRPSCAPMPIRH